jgi:hypothetical protein
MGLLANIKSSISRLDSVDDTYHIEQLCRVEDHFRSQLPPELKPIYNVLLTLHAAVEQRAGRHVLCSEIEKMISIISECTVTSSMTKGILSMCVHHTPTGQTIEGINRITALELQESLLVQLNSNLEPEGL